MTLTLDRDDLAVLLRALDDYVAGVRAERVHTQQRDALHELLAYERRLERIVGQLRDQGRAGEAEERA